MKRSLYLMITCVTAIIAAVSFLVGLVAAGASIEVRVLWFSIPLIVVAIVSGLVIAYRLSSMLRGEAADVQKAVEEFPDVPWLLRPPSGYLGTFWNSLEKTRDAALQHAQAIEKERSNLAAVLNSMQDWVVAVDSSGYVEWVNRTMREAFNGTLKSGRPLAAVIPDANFLNYLEECQKSSSVLQQRCPDLLPGRVFDVIATAKESGGAVAVLQERTRMEQVERTQREFIGNVSHELRTPLTSISGFVETMLEHEETLTPTSRGFLETILKNTVRMTRLTDDLLVMARVENGETKFEPKAHRASELVHETVAALHGLVTDAGAELALGQLTTVTVRADADAVNQVLANLIENAIKYGVDPVSGSVRIEISAMAREDDVEFRVRDWGEGVDPEHRERLFERFYRIDKARSRETGGTGLGLAIARHIVHAHGGNISVESNPGEGSAFVFTLPRSTSEEPGSGLG